MCSNNVQLSSNYSAVKINTANSALNGTGPMGLVITANGPNGTQISSLTIKAEGSTNLGMIRLFVDNGVTRYLYRECMVPAVNQTGTVPTFSAIFDQPIFLQSGYSLYASTQVGQPFNIVAVGTDRTNCDC